MFVLSGGNVSNLNNFVLPVIKGVKNAKAKFITFEDYKTMAIPKGSVVLALGNKSLELLQDEGAIPKNRAMASMRGQEIVFNGSSWFFSYDPYIITQDYSKKTLVAWDIKLALRKELTGSTAPEVGTYSFVDDWQFFIKKIEDTYAKTGKAVAVCCDTETIGLNPYLEDKWLESIQFCLEEGVAYCQRFRTLANQPLVGDTIWNQIDWILNSPKVKIVGANFKYDLRWMLVKWDMTCTNYAFDTTLVGSLLDENRSNSLETHAKVYTSMGGYDATMNTTYDKGRMDLIPDDDFLTYSAGDVDACLRVYVELRKELLQDPFLTRFYVRLLHRSNIAFMDMECLGVCLDKEYQGSLALELEQDRLNVSTAMLEKLPVKLRLKHADNLSIRPAILKDYFFGARGLGLPPKLLTEKTQQPSTALEHFMMFSDCPEATEFVSLLKKYGSAGKTLSTYVVGFNKHLQADGRFHPDYMLHKGDYNGAADSGTDTGRSSCKSPALQCLPADAEVLTDLGVMPMLDIIEGCEGGVPVQVLTHTGEWKPVVGTYRNGVQPLHEFTLADGKTLQCTGNHPILTTKGFILAKDITKEHTFMVRGTNE